MLITHRASVPSSAAQPTAEGCGGPGSGVTGPSMRMWMGVPSDARDTRCSAVSWPRQTSWATTLGACFLAWSAARSGEPGAHLRGVDAEGSEQFRGWIGTLAGQQGQQEMLS